MGVPAALVAAWLLLLPAIVWAGALERAMLGKSTIVDLSHRTAAAPSAANAPRHRPEDGEAVAETGSAAPPASCLDDFGTRMTVLEDARRVRMSVASIPVRDLLVRAVVVDISARVAETAGYRLTIGDLNAWERSNGRIPGQSAVLLRTGWDRVWINPTRYLNRDSQGSPEVPGFSPESAAFLAAQREVRGLGLDAFVPREPAGPDGGTIVPGPAGVWVLENLTNLERLPAKGAKLVVAPVRVEAECAPARVFAILP